MNTTHTFAFRLVILAAFAFSQGALSHAQDPGSEEPLPPGSGFSHLMAGLNPANWSMPKFKMPSMNSFLPTKAEKERVITKKNSFVDEVSTTAKQSWSRTKQTLNPMRLVPAGFKQNATTTPAPPKEKQGGFFSNLFSPFPKSEEQETKPSVNDWLKQEPIR